MAISFVILVKSVVLVSVVLVVECIRKAAYKELNILKEAMCLFMKIFFQFVFLARLDCILVKHALSKNMFCALV